MKQDVPQRRLGPQWIFGLIAGALCAGGASAARADDTPPSCRLLQYSFEPDCFERSNAGTCRFDVNRLDLGPQIAVWVESADGSTFVDTLMVTNAVALYGIANRPGLWDFRSGPRFPYGRRPMALPVWAHRRGELYDSLVMEDGRDDWMTSHEEVSSPEAYFCRPMMNSEVVDAVTCPSGLFRSAKGIFDQTMPQTFYPPRGDLLDWGNICMPNISITGTACDYGDARQFGLINDVDAVAAATPPYDQSFTGNWTIPSTLAAGDYALMLEVSKEYDTNASFNYPTYINATEEPFFNSYGQDGNLGQPSVVYRLPFQVSAAPIAATAVAAPVGYGDSLGTSGALNPIDATISNGPGSGLGRLRTSDGPGGAGAVHLAEVSCAPLDCSVAPVPVAPRLDEPTSEQAPNAAQFTFRQADDSGAPVISYELRYTLASTYKVDESTFAQWTPAQPPGVDTPGTISTATVGGLFPNTGYAIGLRAKGSCGWSAPAVIRIHTAQLKFVTLSGCVIATAAYGSELDPDVALLRRERDWAAERSGLVRLAARLYADEAPPLAALISRSDTARAIIRAALRPALAVNRAALAAAGYRLSR
jgi:hypothetical protein